MLRFSFLGTWRAIKTINIVGSLEDTMSRASRVFILVAPCPRDTIRTFPA
jgi:hypothetical protein